MAKSKDTSRRGPLSSDDKVYIKRNISSKSIDQIASHLKRNSRSIKKYAIDNDLFSPELNHVSSEESTIINQLHSLPWWPSITNQFNEKEIYLFEQQWVRLYKQFDYDVLPSEEIQIRKYITIEILKDRSLAKVKQTEEMVDLLESQYKSEMSCDPKDRDSDLLTDLRSQIGAYKNSAPTHTRDYEGLIKQQNDIEKGLSASRNDRIKNIQDATNNWSNVLRLLEDAKNRRKLGQHIEIMRAARDKEMERLTSPHQFVDKEVDRPILSGKLEEYYK